MSTDPSGWQLTLQDQCTQSPHDSLLPQSLLAIAQCLTHAEGTAGLIPAQGQVPPTAFQELVGVQRVVDQAKNGMCMTPGLQLGAGTP